MYKKLQNDVKEQCFYEIICNDFPHTDTVVKYSINEFRLNNSIVIKRPKQKHIHINTPAINIKQTMKINFQVQNSHTSSLLLISNTIIYFLYHCNAVSINQNIYLIMSLISEVIAKFFSESRMILFWAINKAFYVFIDLLCHTALYAMT
jgi:hypothetical protein